MADTTPNPLTAMDAATEARVRERAYHLWEQEGRPEGREAYYWEQAELLTRMEASPHAGEVPLHNGVPPGEVVEEASIQENLGEFPGRLTDQGDRLETPQPRHRRPS